MSYCWIGLWMEGRLLLSIEVERLNELWIVALCTKIGKGIIIHYVLHLVWDKWTEISSSHKDLELWGGIHWCAELRNRDLQILVKAIGVNKFTWSECKEEWIWNFPGFQVLLRIWWKLRLFFFFFFFKYILVNISMLVSLGFYNKVPQSGGLKTTEIYCLMFLEARRQKSGCWQAPFSPWNM